MTKKVTKKAEKKVDTKSLLQDKLNALTKRFEDSPVTMGVVDLSYERLRTGSLQLDIATNGGWVYGGINALEGWESSGKTTMLYYAIAEHQRNYPDKAVLMVDYEQSYNTEYASRLGVDTKNVILTQPPNFDDGLTIMLELAETGLVGLIAIDSVASTMTKTEMEGEIDKQTIGQKPKMSGKFLSKINPFIRKHNIAMFVLNQKRTDPGIMYGSKDTVPGGNAWRFFYAIRVDVMRSTAKSKVVTDKEGAITAFAVTARVLKNKSGSPMLQAEYRLRTGDNVGLDKIFEIYETCMRQGWVTKAGSWYSYIDEDTGEITRIGQGETSVLEWLESNPDIVESILDKVYTILDGKESTLVSDKVKESEVDAEDLEDAEFE